MEAIETIYFATLTTILSASIGSFIACFAYRYNRHISIVKVQHSFCDNCEKKLTFLELVPILNVIYTKGKCRECGYVYPKHSFVTEVVFAFVITSTYVISEEVTTTLSVLGIISVLGFYILSEQDRLNMFKPKQELPAKEVREENLR